MTATTNSTTSSTDYIRSLDTNDPNDVDAILEVTNTDRDAAISVVKNNADTIFTWDYEKGRSAPTGEAVREVETLDVGRRDRPRLVDQCRIRSAGCGYGDCWARFSFGLSTEPPRSQAARSRIGATRSSTNSVCSRWSGNSASSCTANRVRWWRPPRSSKPFLGSTPNTTHRPRSWTKLAMSKSSPNTSTPRSRTATRSTLTFNICSMMSSMTPGGT